MSRVLLAHKHFRPDATNYAQMLDTFAQHLSGLGHDVHVFTCVPTYHNTQSVSAVPRLERADGVTIHRMRVPFGRSAYAKAMSSVAFPFGLVAHCWSRRTPYDTVSVTTMPPVVMGVAGRAAAARSRRSKLIYHCMDLYPEAAQALGLVGNGLLAKIGARVDDRTMNRAAQTIVLSDDMARTATKRSSTTSNIAVCNNFVANPSPADSSTPAPNEWTSDRYRIVFAGNVGRFQGLGTVIDAVALLKHRADFELLLLGNGAMTQDIADRATAESLPIRLLPHRPEHEAAAVIGAADLAIVSLAPGVIDAAYPSKTMTYLDLNVPVLAVVEPTSELAATITTSGCGLAASNTDPASVAAAIEQAIDGPLERPNGRNPFDRSETLALWTQLYQLNKEA